VVDLRGFSQQADAPKANSDHQSESFQEDDSEMNPFIQVAQRRNKKGERTSLF